MAGGCRVAGCGLGSGVRHVCILARKGEDWARKGEDWTRKGEDWRGRVRTGRGRVRTGRGRVRTGLTCDLALFILESFSGF
jgi:hypothetical protein